MKKLKFILSALMLTVCMSAFIGAGGATAFAYDGEQESVAECAHEYTEEVVEALALRKGIRDIPARFAAIPIRTTTPRRTGIGLTKS